jgi:1A family penicillin-binding protein
MSFFRKNKLSRQHKRKAEWLPTKGPLRALFFFVLLTAILGLGIFAFIAKDLPDPQELNERQIAESTKIFDRTGKIILYDIHGEEKRTIVGLDQISPYLKNATIVTEDVNFYNHFGLDFKGITRAALGVITGNRSAGGGSTITQQFIKNAILTDEHTFTRKIKEAVLSLELERRYSKDEILSFYLNQIPYGSNSYGVEAAAQTFFGKTAKDLTLGEAALLAALPQAPSRLSPYGSHPEELKARQDYILDRLVRYNFVSAAEADAAKKEPLKLSTQAHGIKAPHFVMYVKEYLENKYGADYVEKSGLKVYTTLDWDLQQAAQQIISEGAQNNWKKYKAYNAALAAIDPKTGQILVMVGSRDYFDVANDGNVNVTIRDRQPGSSFKPFAYATALEKGYTPDTVLFDLKTEFNPNCAADASQNKDQYGLDCYSPGNYDDRFRGPITARLALAQSLNIPSVEMLYLAGIEDTIKKAKAMGITSLNNNYYGLSLVLGGGEVKLLDEVAAYGVFATEGIKNDKSPILKIEDKNGNMIEEYKDNQTEVLGKQTARNISAMLSDNEARSPVFGAASPLYLKDRPAAVKTGTTQGYRDAWTVGYTPSLVAGVWVGNNNNKPMTREGAGMAAAAPLWNSFIKKAYELKINCQEEQSKTANYFCLPKEKEEFTKPEPIVTNKSILNGSYTNTVVVKINKLSGLLANENTPPDLIEEKTYQEAHSILHYVKTDEPQGKIPTNPNDDPQYKNWETVAQNWLKDKIPNDGNPIPTQTDDSNNEKNIPIIKIISPFSGQTFGLDKINIFAEVTAPLGIKQVDYFFNDDFIGSVFFAPYQISFTPPINTPSGINTIKAVAYDWALNRQEEKITIYIR